MVILHTAQFLLYAATVEENIELEGTLKMLLESKEITARLNIVWQIENERRMWQGSRILIRCDKLASIVN